MLGQRRANAHTLGGVGPCGAGDPGGPWSGADGRALRARTGGRALRARTAPSAPTGPKGHWDFSEGWPNGRLSNEETHLKSFFLFIIAPNVQMIFVA